MRNQSKRQPFSWLVPFAAVWLAAGTAGTAGAAGAPARITSTAGDSRSGGALLEQRGALEDGADLETGDDGGCSVLMDEDALMELCAGTSVKLDRKDGQPDGPRVVKLDKGEIRMVVEPRLSEERIEIHTPAAIATLLGTIVHVSVNALGAAHIAAGANRVGVLSTSTGENVILEPGEEVDAVPNQPLRKQVIDPQAPAPGGCLIDFHQKAAEKDSGDQQQRDIDTATAEDIFDGDLPQVAAAETSNQEFDNRVTDFESDAQKPDPNTDPPNTIVDNIVVSGVMPPGAEAVRMAIDNGGMPGGIGEVPPIGGDCPGGLPPVGETCM